MKKISGFLSIMMISAMVHAEATNETGLYRDGKIYVVVILLSIIFLGLAFYLFKLDRKISKLEKHED